MTKEAEVHGLLNQIAEYQEEIERLKEQIVITRDEKELVDSKNYQLRKELKKLKALHKDCLKIILAGVSFLVAVKVGELLAVIL